jgi:hypothetical protein
MVNTNAHEASLARQGWRLTEDAHGRRQWIAPEGYERIERQLDEQALCCSRGVHAGVVYVRGGVERWACCDRVTI